MDSAANAGSQVRFTKESSSMASMKASVVKLTTTLPTSVFSKTEKELEKAKEFGSRARRILGTTTTMRSRTSMPCAIKSQSRNLTPSVKRKKKKRNNSSKGSTL